jgi:hypothetical protein
LGELRQDYPQHQDGNPLQQIQREENVARLHSSKPLNGSYRRGQ